MIYHDQNKDDDRMINDLYRAERALREEDNFSKDLFEYGTQLSKLSRIDPETGYDDYDPRDLEPPEEIYVSHDIGSIPCARLVPDSTLVSDPEFWEERFPE